MRLSAGDTHPLRRSVLRTGTLSDVVVFDGDELDTTLHLGIRLRTGGPIVAVSTWLERAWPGDVSRPAFQVRGMATAPELRGTGLGTTLLRAGVDVCVERGAALVWARARTTALDFYVRHGFETAGDVYIDATTGLPHRDIVMRIG